MGTVGIVPVMATSGAKIGGFGNIGGGHAGSGCDWIDRGGSCQHKGCRNGGGSEPSLHVNAPVVQQDADQRITRAQGSSDISTQDRPANCGPASKRLRAAILPAAPVAPVAMMVPAMPAAPAHFSGHLSGIILNRGGGAGTAQRQCLGALDGSRQQEQSADRGEAQECLHVHGKPFLGHRLTPASSG